MVYMVPGTKSQINLNLAFCAKDTLRVVYKKNKINPILEFIEKVAYTKGKN
jgi:hypothetical protein